MERRAFLKGSALTVAAVALFKHKATDTPLPTDRPVVIAAADSPLAEQHAADVRCNGVADNIKIQSAIDAGCSIRMTGGTFNIGNQGIMVHGEGHYIVGNRFVTA